MILAIVIDTHITIHRHPPPSLSIGPGLLKSTDHVRLRYNAVRRSCMKGAPKNLLYFETTERVRLRIMKRLNDNRTVSRRKTALFA